MWRTATVVFVAMLLALSAGAALGQTTINGTPGDDKIDALDPSSGDTISGGPGNDTITANDGDNDGVNDDINCGPGSRDIAYSDKGDSVNSDCEWHRSYDTPRYCSFNGGPPWTNKNTGGEWPQGLPWVGEKIIWCIDGTPRDNKIRGTTGHSDLLDSIWADKGDDTLNGGVGPDSLEGWSGNDILKGGAGTDFLFGDSKDNPIDPPHFFKGAGKDKIHGGPGSDFISAIDNKKDTISCGGGDDVVYRDKRGVFQTYGAPPHDPALRSTVTDKVANDCEKIKSKAEQSMYFCRLFGILDVARWRTFCGDARRMEATKSVPNRVA